MKLFKKVLAGVAVAAAMTTSAYASPITVQGVTWDPDMTLPVVDFQANTTLYQWYQTAANGLTFNPTGGVATFVNPTSLVNTYVTGAGAFTLFNGVNDSNTNPGDTTPADFINGQLTLTFGGILITSVVTNGNDVLYTFDLSNSYFNVYSNTNPNNYQGGSLAGQVSAANNSYATPFLSGKFDKFGVDADLLAITTGGTKLKGDSDGLMSVTGGAAFGNFDTNTQFNPFTQLFSDISFVGSSQIYVGSQISTVGGNEFTGNTIPEPESLALVGLGLLGLAAARRRKSA